MSNTDTPATPTTQIRIRLDHLRESLFNPRKIYDETSLQELADNIKAQGILQRPLVRPVPSDEQWHGDRVSTHELVFGHRRARAAHLAGLTEIDVDVRDMTDEEARRAQISENLARKDVHPIEEAEGFHALMQEHGTTAQQLIEQTGKSKSYIYGRLKLLNAVPDVRIACLKGEISSEVCLLIARIHTHKLQGKALAAIKSKYYSLEDGGARSFRQIRDLLREKFTLNLGKDTIFDTADALLLPDAGACTACPKRTANAPEYSDLLQAEHDHYRGTQPGQPNLCTDPDCYEAKKKQHLANKAAELEAKGKTVITGAKARQIVGAYGDIKGGYIPLKDVRDQLKKIKGDKPETITVQNPRDGKTVEVIKATDLQASGVKVKEAPAPRNTGGGYDYEAERRKREGIVAKETPRRMALLQAVRTAAATRERDEFDLRLVAHVAISGVQYSDRQLLQELYGLDNSHQLEKRVDSMTVPELTQLVLDCGYVRDLATNGYNNTKPPAILHAVAEHYGLDPKAIYKQADADAKAAAKATAVQTPAPKVQRNTEEPDADGNFALEDAEA